MNMGQKTLKSAKSTTCRYALCGTAALLFCFASVLSNCFAAMSQGFASVSLQVQPAAAINVSVVPGPQDQSSTAVAHVELAVRVNRGASAAVWLVSPDGDAPKMIFSIPGNGRYSFDSEIPATTSGYRLELRSSDGVLSAFQIL
jgi:hypothetical protein